MDNTAEEDDIRARIAQLERELEEARTRADRAEQLLNTPELHDFAKAVALEAAHQRERWDSAHDSGKTQADWFWLVAYLAGKALHAASAATLPRYRHIKRGSAYEVISVGEDENNRGTDLVVYRGEDDGRIWVRPAAQFYDGRFQALPPKPSDKALHHVITTAAACANWHAALRGTTDMRPGISAEQQSAIDDGAPAGT